MSWRVYIWTLKYSEYNLFFLGQVFVLRLPVQHGDQVCNGTHTYISFAQPLMSFAIPVVGDASDIRSHDLRVVRYSGQHLTLEYFARLIIHFVPNVYILKFSIFHGVNIRG